jgi:hypothetical protein
MATPIIPYLRIITLRNAKNNQNGKPLTGTFWSFSALIQLHTKRFKSED